MKIDDLHNVNTEVDSNINRSQTLHGQITSIQKINTTYICQGCGGINLKHEIKFISCNDCHSRILKQTETDQAFYGITILTPNNEQFDLKVAKSLMSDLLQNNNALKLDACNKTDDNVFLNSIISKNVKFTFNQNTAIIDTITIINDEQSFETGILNKLEYLIHA
jgi:DNA-directed RNA polymerase subunit RPC12/RpoP